MKKNIFFYFIPFFFLITVYSYAVQSEPEPVQVIATIPPLAEFAEKVGGAHIHVETMILPGSNPHIYEPTPNQLKRLSEARLYIAVGSRMEFEIIWLDKIKKMNPSIGICDVSEEIEKMDSEEHHHEGAHVRHSDPHTWLSPPNAVKMVDSIAKVLSELDPKNNNSYKSNAEKYKSELRKLDEELRQKLMKFKGSKFLIYHPGWAYFAKEYGLEEKAIEFEGKEPTAKRLSALVTEMKNSKIRTIFSSPFSPKRNAEVVASAIGANVVLIDELAKDYIQNMHETSDKIVKALE